MHKIWRFREDMLNHYINGLSVRTFQDAEDRLNYLEEKFEENCMGKVNKTKGNLTNIWNDLDIAYEHMERALEKLSSMSGLPDDLLDEIDSFDISAISSLMERVDILSSEITINT